MSKNKNKIYKIPILGFLILIIIGSIFLKLPICNNNKISFIDSLFVATSGVCITGYTPVILANQFTWIGQVIILVMVEIGALGFMTIIIFSANIIRKKIYFSDAMVFEDGELNANFKERAKNIVIYTLLIEIIGAILLSLKFIKVYGLQKGIWYSIFHSITAFCNSGFDIIGEKSFEPFTKDIYINCIIMGLIVIGGIGFPVLEDIFKTKKLKFQSKIVLISTLLILLFSIIYIKLMEPNLTVLQVCFTSVTLRTAGFSTIDMSNCSQATKMIATFLMFIGGAPGSTAGGIRVVAFSVLVISIISTLKNRREVIVLDRRIGVKTIIKSITITGWAFISVLFGIIVMLSFDNIGLQNIVFHCVGAFSNTGLGIFPTSNLNIFGKFMIMILMFIGRLGPIVAFRVFFDTGEKDNNIKYVEGELML